MRILVTGAAGFIASNLIPRLLRDGHEVLGIDNFFLGRRAHLESFGSSPGFRFIEQDLLDGEPAKPYVHVEDCLDGMKFGQTRASARLNGYNLAVPDQTNVKHIATWCPEELGIPPATCVLQHTGGARGWKGDVAFVNRDTTRMSTLGWSPSLSSDEAVRRTIREVAGQFRLMQQQGTLPHPGIV